MGVSSTMKRHKSLIGVIVLLIIVVIVLAQNRDYVQIKVLFWHFSAHKILFIVGVMIFGYLVGRVLEVSLRK